MKKFTINIAQFIAIPIAIFLCITKRVDWWTFFVIMILSFKIDFEFTRR